MPEPRSSTRDAVGAQLVPYHAVSTSSVEKRCPSRSWKMRKCPLIASSVSSGGTAGGESAPGGIGPGFAQPLKWDSGLKAQDSQLLTRYHQLDADAGGSVDVVRGRAISVRAAGRSSCARVVRPLARR